MPDLSTPHGNGTSTGGNVVIATLNHHTDKVLAHFWHEVNLAPRILVMELSVVILLSALFESWEHWLRHRAMHHGDKNTGKILDALFKELAGLGFVALLLYILVQSGWVDAFSSRLFSDLLAHHVDSHMIAENFETVHMMIFLLMVVLLVQALAIVHVAGSVTELWSRYEKMRSYGTKTTSLEMLFLKGGYLQKTDDKAAPRGFTLDLKRPFTYGNSFTQRLHLRYDGLHKLVMWRAIRHEFLFGEGKDMEHALVFNFANYLKEKLGKSVQSLVEVEMWTWLVTILIVLALEYSLNNAPPAKILAVACAALWGLLGVTVTLSIVLEEDTYWLTPQVPQDARNILELFAATNPMMLSRRQAGTLDSYWGQPGLGNYNPSFTKLLHREGKQLLSPKTYQRILELLSFWQALGVSALIILHYSATLETRMDYFLYSLAWLEWPIFIFKEVPILLRRVTIRTSIATQVDKHTLRKIVVDGQESMMRDHIRVAHLLVFVQRSAEDGKAWAQCPASQWTKASAKAAYTLGLRKFACLPFLQRRGITRVFESWDVENDGSLTCEQIEKTLMRVTQSNFWRESAASPCNATTAASHLVSLVDYDCKKRLTLEKCEALFAFAASRPQEEVEEDLKVLFQMIGPNGQNQLPSARIAEWFVQSIRSGLREDDAALLMYKYFGHPKIVVTEDEFIEWLMSVLTGKESAVSHAHGHGHGAAHELAHI